MDILWLLILKQKFFFEEECKSFAKIAGEMSEVITGMENKEWKKRQNFGSWYCEFTEREEEDALWN